MTLDQTCWDRLWQARQQVQLQGELRRHGQQARLVRCQHLQG